MRKKLICCFGGLSCFLISNAQLSENFSDGNFINNPTWIGGTTDFIINSRNQLQSNNLVSNAMFYLSTANSKATTTQWGFSCNITFNPSGTNYIDVFLTASASDLIMTSTSGYFVRIGGTEDEISLFRKDATGLSTKIIDGTNGILNTSNSNLKIRVVRNSSNQWTLSRDLDGAGVFTEGIATDATFLTSSYFGVLVKQSTSSFFQQHYFDDFTIEEYIPDITPPAITVATARSSSRLDILFNEPVEIISSQAVANYYVNSGTGFPVAAVRDATNSALVHLSFAASFPNRIALQLTVNGVKDLAGNVQATTSTSFSYFTAAQYDVVIDEIMADPTPQVGLPNYEWIELRNTSGFDIDLQNWKIGDAGGQSGPMPAYLLKSDSFVIVCAASAASAMRAFGPVTPVTSFPSLDNSKDLVYLKSPDNSFIHAINYNETWYQNELKKNGGWALEMIDSKNPCGGITNWKASSDAKGGTPGNKNVIDANNPDQTAPKLLRAFATNALDVVLYFDESLDSTKASLTIAYIISDGIGSPVQAMPVGPLYNTVNLKLLSPLKPNKVYSITVSVVTDCSGNIIASGNTVKLGLPAPINRFDLVVNEVLFNPAPTSVDYVEIYNRSNKTANLKNAYLANRNNMGTISSIVQLTSEDRAFYPGEFIVATSNVAAVTSFYIAQDLNAFLTVSIPSYNDDAGQVIILNEQGNIIDEISYADNWQFPLLINKEGVALERIDPADTSLAPNIQKKNWHSAATSVGYGTPTYKNSQFRVDLEVQGNITVSPEIISPDNDGFEDFATIYYRFPEPGYVASITIFDGVGRPVRYLQRNALSGTNGYYRWDGLGEKQQILPAGLYIVYTEVFNLNGKTKRFKNTIVLAKRK